MRTLKWIACLLVMPFVLGGTWKENGKPVPDTAWAKSDGDFGAQLVFTDKPDELFAAWEKPGPTATRGVPIVGVIFFIYGLRDRRARKLPGDGAIHCEETRWQVLGQACGHRTVA